MKSTTIVTVLFLAFLVMVNVWIILTGSTPWFVSSLNILFHEAGHVIFGLFGHFIGVLGGTLGELLVPMLIVGYFWRRAQYAGQAFGLWWLGLALYDVSVYASDARAQRLELIGGPGGHDWFYLLGHTRLLDYDQTVGKLLVIAALFATVYSGVMIYRYWQGQQGRIIS
ncbi:hypothetical protein KC929_03195 [Patescibacteria group bacterium]|nr:hypothetical protein [Patescibacteria group bacterium]